MTFTFREEDHTYWLDGKQIPGVTSILKPLLDYSHVPADVLERARQEGKAIHKMVELDALGTLDVAGLPEWLAPVYREWQSFRDASGFRLILSEYQTYHPTLKYGGQLDLLCELTGLKGWKGTALVDVKRSLLAGPVIGLQLAGYQLMLDADDAMPRVKHRGALRLGPSGGFRFERFDDRTDAATFLALLTINRWREQHAR